MDRDPANLLMSNGRGLVFLDAESAAVGARLLPPLGADDKDLPTGVVGYTEHRWLAHHKRDPLPGIDVFTIPLSELEDTAAALDERGCAAA